MQRSVNHLKRPLEIHTNPLKGTKIRIRKQSRSSLAFLKEKSSLPLSYENIHNRNPSLSGDYEKANKFLSTLQDPLWKHVCDYIINMMGPASLLRIEGSSLGEIHSQGQSVEILCTSEETAQFIQQYDFVILGSLEPYFPTLKELRVKVISKL